MAPQQRGHIQKQHAILTSLVEYAVKSFLFRFLLFLSHSVFHSSRKRSK